MQAEEARSQHRSTAACSSTSTASVDDDTVYEAVSRAGSRAALTSSRSTASGLSLHASSASSRDMAPFFTTMGNPDSVCVSVAAATHALQAAQRAGVIALNPTASGSDPHSLSVHADDLPPPSYSYAPLLSSHVPPQASTLPATNDSMMEAHAEQERIRHAVACGYVFMLMRAGDVRFHLLRHAVCTASAATSLLPPPGDSSQFIPLNAEQYADVRLLRAVAAHERAIARVVSVVAGCTGSECACKCTTCMRITATIVDSSLSEQGCEPLAITALVREYCKLRAHLAHEAGRTGYAGAPTVGGMSATATVAERAVKRRDDARATARERVAVLEASMSSCGAWGHALTVAMQQQEESSQRSRPRALSLGSGAVSMVPAEGMHWTHSHARTRVAGASSRTEESVHTVELAESPVAAVRGVEHLGPTRPHSGAT